MTKSTKSTTSKSASSSVSRLSWIEQFHIAAELKAQGDMRKACGKFQYLADWCKKFNGKENPVADLLMSRQDQNRWENRRELCQELSWECAQNSREGLVA